MAYAVTGLIGASLDRVTTAAELSGDQKKTLDNALGQQAWGNDGRLYVFAVAGGAIPASTAVASVNATTFSATATGGSYLSPAVAMATGDYGWLSKASV